MILARNSITLHHLRDITTVVWYYKLQASTASPPAKPTTETPSGWSTTEPSYTEGSTNSLYVVQKTTFSDGTFEYSDVSLSTSYEAAKAAYNKSVQAKATADAAQENIDNLEIGGRNLLLNTRISPLNLSKIRASACFSLVTEDNIACYKTTGNNTAHLFNGTNQWDCTSEKLKANTTYTYSAWIKTDKAQSFGYMQYGHFNVSNSASAKSDKTHEDIAEKRIYKPETIPADQWTKISITFTTNNLDGSSFGVYPVYNTGTETNLFIYGMKLEKGAKATDWTPAPEDMQADIDALQPELIVGTHGTTATATWTGTSTVLTEIKAGTRIQYKLSSAGASNVTLNLTLKGGTTTGAKPVYFLNATRLGTQYDVNAIVDLIYDGSAWRVLNPYTNSKTVGTYGGAVKAGANGVKNYSLVMRDTETTWVSLTTTAGTGTSKSRYTGKLFPDKVMYMGSNNAYASGATTGTCYEALGVNLQYSTNCGSTLTSGRAVYLVGTLDSDGLFTLDATWWTQTIPTTADGKTYIYLGLAYSTTNIYLVPENTLYQYFEGAFRTLREIEEMKASKVADNYLSADNTGIMVADMTDGTQYTPSNVPSGTKNTFINEDSFQVRNGTDVLASFGETSQIGKDDANHQEIDASGIHGINSEKIEIFGISMDGGIDYTTMRVGASDMFTVWDVPFDRGGGVFITQTENGPKEYVYDLNSLPIPYGGSLVFRIDILQADPEQYSYRYLQTIICDPLYWGIDDTLTINSDYGTRHVLRLAANEGKVYNTMILTATGITYQNRMAATVGNVAVTITIPAPAYALGTRNEQVKGAYSATCGEFLSARERAQFACGKFNADDPDYAFMVGNGDETNGDSNAFAATWDGDVLMALDEDAATGIDAELYAAITAHGWESEVIV